MCKIFHIFRQQAPNIGNSSWSSLFKRNIFSYIQFPLCRPFLQKRSGMAKGQRGRQTVDSRLCAYTPNKENENLLRHRIASKLNRKDN